MNLIEFYQTYNTEEACLAHLEKARWGKDGENRYCPHCGSVTTYRFKDGKLFKCADCRKQFTVKVGTIFSDSKIPLVKWYLAIYLASSLKKGISSVQLAKYIKVTQKTSWFMLHRIREAFQNNGHANLLGDTEMDETYHGKHGRPQNRSNKATIFGMFERGGEVRTVKVKSAGARVLLPIINQNVAKGSTIYTDQWNAYKTLARRGYRHEAVNHSIGEYARGAVTTNSLEGFWSHFKRTVFGTYHFVSVKHVGRYANESAYRYNTRELTDGERFEAWFGRVACRMDWRTLTA